jgi:hypothetical protein
VIRYLSTQFGRLPAELTHQPEGWVVVLVDEHPSLSGLGAVTADNPYVALALLEQRIRALSTPAGSARHRSSHPGPASRSAPSAPGRI